MARTRIDLTGRTFGQVQVVAYGGRYKGKGESMWECACSCGKSFVTVGSGLRDGRTLSCGCLRAKRIGALNRTHGHSPGSGATAEYQCWANMITRCTNPNAINWDDYGGRGISVCPRWRSSFAAFLADMGPKPSRKHSIDRINNDGNYEPLNCRWATLEVQRANRSNSIIVLFRGEHMTLTKAIKVAGNPISRSCATLRLRKGWSIEDVLFAPKTRIGVAA